MYRDCSEIWRGKVEIINASSRRSSDGVALGSSGYFERNATPPPAFRVMKWTLPQTGTASVMPGSSSKWLWSIRVGIVLVGAMSQQRPSAIWRSSSGVPDARMRPWFSQRDVPVSSASGGFPRARGARADRRRRSARRGSKASASARACRQGRASASCRLKACPRVGP